MLQFAFMTRAMLWGLWRIGAEAGAGGFVWIALSLVAAGIIATVRRARPPLRAPRLLLAAQPAIWVAIGVWGAAVSLAMYRDPGRANPLWVFYPIDIGFLAFVVLGLATIAWLRGGRLFAALFFVVNLGLALMVSVFADMAVSGMRI
jgi:hypothetical protein